MITFLLTSDILEPFSSPPTPEVGGPEPAGRPCLEDAGLRIKLPNAVGLPLPVCYAPAVVPDKRVSLRLTDLIPEWVERNDGWKDDEDRSSGHLPLGAYGCRLIQGEGVLPANSFFPAPSLLPFTINELAKGGWTTFFCLGRCKNGSN